MFSEELIFITLQKILSQTLSVPAASITKSSSMDNLAAWDSLHFLIIINETEEAFDFRFSSAEIISLRSVPLLIEAVKRKKKGPL